VTDRPAEPCGASALLAHFGRIDIYLFDQLLRGRVSPEMRVLDAGCGAGRNSEYLMRCGADVYGVDADAKQVARVRELAAKTAPDLPSDNFAVRRLDDLPYDGGHFDAVLCSAVLHFSEDEEDFEAMVREMWRVLAAGGLFFARLASSIGLADRAIPFDGRWHHLPDGSDRFLVDEEYLLRITSELGGELLDPLKTTIVQDMRAMTTWVVGKAR